MEDGWTAISRFFLEQYAQLRPYPLTTSEAMLVIHLMKHKWDAEAPFTSYRTLAKRMGMSDAAVRAHARKLESKGYLRRVVRVALPNLFHLEPLFEALEKHRAAIKAQEGR